MARKPVVHISPQEFVKSYYENGKSGARAVRAIDKQMSQAVAEVRASRMLSNDKVRLLLDNIEDSFKLSAVKGAKRLHQLVGSNNEQVALSASEKVLNYAGFKPVERSEVKSTLIRISLGELKPKE